MTSAAPATHRRLMGMAVALGLVSVACGGPVPPARSAPPPPSESAPAASSSATAAASPKPEAATYARRYCAALAAWDTAFDHVMDWSSEARLDPSTARVPDPDTADAIAAMRTEIEGISAFPPVLPIARALTKAAHRLERVVGLLGSAMEPGAVAAADLEQEVTRLSADMASAAEFHRVAEGSYGTLGCPSDGRPRVMASDAVVSVVLPDGWRLFGPSAEDQANQLETIGDPAYASRVLELATLLGPTATVVYDEVNPGRSGVGAVTGLDLIPGETDLLGATEEVQAALSATGDLADVAVRYIDRPAGDGARLVADSDPFGLREHVVLDVIRVEEGLILVLTAIPRADAASYWLAIERIVGSVRIDP